MVKEQAAPSQMGDSLIYTGRQRIGKGKKIDNWKAKRESCKTLRAIHKHLLASCQQHSLHFQARMTLPYSCCKNSVQSSTLIFTG